MPRIAELRPAVEPSSPQQRERVRRILRAAARQGAELGLDGVQMHDVAKESGVAIATLYRYFPSKMHLFTAVMRSRVDRVVESVTALPKVADPVLAVTELLVATTKEMLKAPLLAHAMMISNNAALFATDAEANKTHEVFGALIFRTAGIAKPTPRDVQLIRLVVQAWYGINTAALNQHHPEAQVEGDVRLACELLLAPWAGQERPT